MTLSPQTARNVLHQAEVLYTADQVQIALQKLAQHITSELSDQHPLILAVMGGAVVFAGQLLPLLNFPLDFDYVQATRYGNQQQGGEISWRVQPGDNVKGRVILALDDILDEGHTLNALKARVLEMGASKFYCAAFADKLHGREKPLQADFVGLTLPDRFVFGYGMDINGAWRNLPAIYAIKESKS